MPLTSKIVPYDANWPRLFAIEKDRISPAFENDLVTVFHVGSTAVPDLQAKPEIDILVEIANHDSAVSVQQNLLELGYVRGTDLSEGHHYYRRNVEGVRTNKLHVCVVGHRQSLRMRAFRDLLRSDDDARQRYGELKLQLERENIRGIGEYLEKKRPFIESMIDLLPERG